MHAVDEHVVAQRHLLGRHGEAQVGQAAQQFGVPDRHLHPGQLLAETLVHAVAEADRLHVEALPPTPAFDVLPTLDLPTPIPALAMPAWLIALDAVDPNPQIFVGTAATPLLFGPFASGTTVKITEAPGATPSIKPMAGAVTAHITLNADALITALDASGGVASVACLVPPPPK